MKFRFETILKLRKNRENLLQKEFALVNAHYLKQEGRLHFMEDVETKSKQELNRRMDRGMTVNQMVLYNHFFNGLKAQETMQGKIVSEVSAQMEKKRANLAEAMRKRRIMEIIKERDTLEFNKLQMKLETDMLDEVGAVQWRMKSS